MTATYEKIASSTLGSSQTTVTFSSISSAYTDLVVVYQGTTSSGGSILMRFNGDTGGNYSWTYMFGNGSTAQSSRTSGSFAWFTDSVISGGSTTYPAQVVMNLNNYSNTTTYKTWLYRLDQVTNSNGAAQAYVGLWRSTSAINQISFYNTTMQTGSTFTIYGIKAE